MQNADKNESKIFEPDYKAMFFELYYKISEAIELLKQAQSSVLYHYLDNEKYSEEQIEFLSSINSKAVFDKFKLD